MPTINHKINMRTLAALKRAYDAQFELYEYALHHSIPIDYTQDVFMRRSLSELADSSEKILAHINLNDYDDDMHMYVRTALASVQNALDVLSRLSDLDARTKYDLGFEQMRTHAIYSDKIAVATKEAEKAIDILTTRLKEGF